MLGAIAGDIIGSAYEHSSVKSEDFDIFPEGGRFTDDTVLTVATAAALMKEKDYAAEYRIWGLRYPMAGFGEKFFRWLTAPGSAPYGSRGNGAAMRVSPAGSYCHSIEETLSEAEESARVTHNHPEGIKGAKAVAAAVYMAKTGKDKKEIKKFIEENFSYDLHRRIADIRPAYSFEVSAAGSVPEAIIAFLESDSYESAIRKAVSLGGDSDTQASIAGAIAESYYGSIHPAIRKFALERLPEDMLGIYESFSKKTLY